MENGELIYPRGHIAITDIHHQRETYGHRITFDKKDGSPCHSVVLVLTDAQAQKLVEAIGKDQP